MPLYRSCLEGSEMNLIQLDSEKKLITSTAAAPAKNQHPAHAQVLTDIPVPDLAELYHSSFAGDKKNRNTTLNSWRQANWHNWQRMLSMIEKRYSSNLRK